MQPPKYVTILIVPEGAEERAGFRMKQWLLKLILGGIATLLVCIILFFVFYGQVITRAALADKLEKENNQLLRYQYKVKLLEENLLEARSVVQRLTDLAGIDYQFPEFPDDSTLFASLDHQNKAVLVRGLTEDATTPSGLPVLGFVSQGFDDTDSSHYHPGIDIACATGTPVLATGSGVVIYAAFDSVYGNMVVVQHNDSISSVYGHNDELLVEVDQKVMPGSRLALSGNTGISTAPHLHYEIRMNNQYMNPLEFPNHEKKQ
jgi:murein DD-endopeptidase MepM/ murein hydrolase activator NlpD